MARIRAFEETLISLRYAQEISGVIHPSCGEEAVAVGVCQALEERDWAVSYYRSHGHALARGSDMTALMMEMFGRRAGLSGGRGGAGRIVDLRHHFLAGATIVGAGVAHAAGLALACQLRDPAAVSAVFFGDGATATGVFHEAATIASAQRLPLVLVCQNNLYQDHTRAEDVLPTLELTRHGTAYDIAAETVDGTDVIAVHEAARRAVEHARGHGPALLVAATYLTYYHSQVGVPPSEYRPAAELASWLRRDPLLRARERLVALGVPEAHLVAAARAADAEVDAAVRAARAAAPPDPETATTNVYCHD